MRTLLAAAVLASLTVATSGIKTVGVTEMASFVQSSHPDAWCNDHFIGSGSQNCLKLTGCCYSQVAAGMFDNTQELGPCHSCDAHQNEWCHAYGDEGLDACLKLGGACSYDYEVGKCMSAEPEAVFTVRSCVDVAADEGAKAAYKQCMDDIDEKYNNTERLGEGRDADGKEIWKKREAQGGCAELYFYTPACTPDDGGELFEAYQADEDGIGPDTYFCVDKEGNEIPDTRKGIPQEKWDVGCEKLRMMHAGMQCPNAPTLFIKGGVGVDNKDDEEDCTQSCNTDKDCAGGLWCCVNDCSSVCQLAIKPMASCGTDEPLGTFQTIVWQEGQENEWGCPPGRGGEDCSRSVPEEHGASVLLACKEGFSVDSDHLANPSVDDIKGRALQCKHGHWESMSGERIQEIMSNLICKKSCEPYTISGFSVIDGKVLRESDFNIEQTHFSDDSSAHGSIANITCADEYGVVSGTDKVRRYSYELLECDEGTWVAHDVDGGAQTIECAVCYDKTEYQWRDENQASCTLYSRRPMLCEDNQEAIDNCRVSCRSCAEAEAKFKIKTKKESLDAVPEDRKSHWHVIAKKVKVEHHRTEIQERTTKVKLDKSQVCINPYDSKVRKLPDGSCPPGYSPME